MKMKSIILSILRGIFIIVIGLSVSWLLDTTKLVERVNPEIQISIVLLILLAGFIYTFRQLNKP